MRNFNRDDRSRPGRDFGRRDFRKRGFDRRGGPREMFKAVCDKCGKDCEIPFEPTEGRPVYCSECFDKQEGRSSPPRDFRGRGPRGPDFERSEAPRPQNTEQFEAINRKLDKILEMLTAPSPKEEVVVEKKTVKVSKKKSPAKKSK